MHQTPLPLSFSYLFRAVCIALSGFILASCRIIPERHAAPEAAHKFDFQFLSMEGTRTVDEKGNSIVLNGCNLGNWFLLEMWMFDLWKLGENEDIHDQYTFERILAERFGEEKRHHLMEIFRENWIRERDFEIVRSFGFNVVRLPFHYSLLEDDARPFQLRPDGLKWLDRAVEMAARNGLYVILDLHGVPGGQSVDHTTGREGQNLVWDDLGYRARTVWLWTEIARHFRDSPVVAAYDLINEPFGDYKSDKHHAALVSLTDECYRAIRALGDRHIIIFPGTFGGIAFYGAPGERGWENAMFTEHFYPGLFGGGEPTIETHKRHINRRVRWTASHLEEVQAGFLVGEFNVVFRRAGGPTMMRHYYDLYGAHGWWSTMWSYRLLSAKGGYWDDNWFMVANAMPAPKISLRASSYGEIEDFFRWLGRVDYVVNDDMRAALTTDTPEPLLLSEPPFALKASHQDVMAGWTAADIAALPPGGQRVFSEERIDVYGGGADIWGARDEFRFLWTEPSGDFDLQAEVLSLDDVHPYSKAGVMIRGSADADAPHALLHVISDSRVIMGWRAEKGAEMKEIKLHVVEFPVRLRLSRRGNIVHASYAIGDGEWRKVNEIECAWLEDRCLAGLAVLSHDTRFLARASFDRVELSLPEKE